MKLWSAFIMESNVFLKYKRNIVLDLMTKLCHGYLCFKYFKHGLLVFISVKNK